MKKFLVAAAAAVLMTAMGTGTALAKAKTYQFTGDVTEVGKDAFQVKKGNEVWEFQIEAATKGAPVKVGDKVTVKYRMSATEIEKK
jgi:hypothetical protein